jgi:hypothetical protein
MPSAPSACSSFMGQLFLGDCIPSAPVVSSGAMNAIDIQGDPSCADRQAHYLLRAVNKANFRFGLLANGDRVLATVSGGKDSTTMLALLHRYRRLAPQRYSLLAAHVISDWHCGQAVPREWLARWCRERAARVRPLNSEHFP